MPWWKKHRSLIVTAAALLVFIWVLPLQTQDGPNHKLVAVILDRLAESPAEQAVYQSNLGLLQTNTLFPALYGQVSRWMSIATYEKLFFYFFLFLIPVTYHWFLREWAADKQGLWFFVLPMWFHPLFITGMYNFLASVSFTLVALILLRRGLATGRHAYLLAFAACCWITFLAHPFPFFVLAICFPILLTFDRQHSRSVSLAYAMVIASFLVIGFLLPLMRNGVEASVPAYVFKAPLELVAGFLYYNFVGYSVGQLLLAVPFFLLMVGLLIHAAVKGSWKCNALWMAMLIGYLVFPSEGNGGAHLNERFLPFVWCFIPLGVSLSATRVIQVRYASVITTVLLAAGVYWGMAKVDLAVADVRTVLSDLPGGSRLYPINFDPAGPALTYSSTMHVWATYDEEKIIFSPYLFAYQDLMPLSRRRAASATYFPAARENLPELAASDRLCGPADGVEVVDCAGRREDAFREIVQHASYYDYWFIRGLPEDFADIIVGIPTLRLVSQQGEASLWHYENALLFDPPLN